MHLSDNLFHPVMHNMYYSCFMVYRMSFLLALSFFCRYGHVSSVRCLPEKYCAFVNFKSKEAAGKAMNALQVSHRCSDNFSTVNI